MHGSSIKLQRQRVGDMEAGWCGAASDIQQGRRGLVPVRSAAVRDEDGSVCSSPEAQQQRWRQHFTKVLNIQSEFSAEELGKVRERPTRPDIAELSSRGGGGGGGGGVALEFCSTV